MLMITCYLHIHDHFRHQPFDLSFQKESIHGALQVLTVFMVMRSQM